MTKQIVLTAKSSNAIIQFYSWVYFDCFRLERGTFSRIYSDKKTKNTSCHLYGQSCARHVKMLMDEFMNTYVCCQQSLALANLLLCLVFCLNTYVDDD